MKRPGPAAAALALTLGIATTACERDRAGAPEPTQGRQREARGSDFINGGDCPLSRHPELPADAGCVTAVTQGAQTLLVYALLDSDDKPRAWRLRLTGGDDDVDQRLRAGTVTSYPRAVGVTDLDGDRMSEWWVKVADYASHGAAWAGLNLFVSTPDALVPVTYVGEPLTVDFGGISRLGEGAVCRDGYLVVLRVSALDRQNTRWRVSERRYELKGTRASLVDRQLRTLVVDSYTDPDLVRNYRVRCDGSTFTPFD